MLKTSGRKGKRGRDVVCEESRAGSHLFVSAAGPVPPIRLRGRFRLPTVATCAVAIACLRKSTAGYRAKNCLSFEEISELAAYLARDTPESLNLPSFQRELRYNPRQKCS